MKIHSGVWAVAIAVAVVVAGASIGVSLGAQKTTTLPDGDIGFGGFMSSIEPCGCGENNGGFMVTVTGNQGGKFIFAPGKTQLHPMGQMKPSFRVLGSAKKGGKCGFQIGPSCVGQDADGVMENIGTAK